MVTFTGDSGDNIFTGDSGSDQASGAGGNDYLTGNAGSDTLAGGSGADELLGGDGDDWLYSEDVVRFSLPYYSNTPFNPPSIDAGGERDTLRGGDGSDRIYAGYGDTVDGGGNGSYGDFLYISFMAAPEGIMFDSGLASQEIGGATITGIENFSFVQGSDFNDTINGRSSGTGYGEFGALMGMGGDDKLYAGYYTGTLFGGDGDDVVDGRGSQYLQGVYGGDGDDTLYTNSNTFGAAYGGDGNDTIYAHRDVYGGEGNDLIVLQTSYYGGAVFGEGGDDEIRAAAGGATINGGSGADRLIGNSGADTLNSFGFLPGNSLTDEDDTGLEQDIVSGGAGRDRISIGIGDDADGGADEDTLRLSLAGAEAGVTFSSAGITGADPFLFAGGTIVNFEDFAYLRGTNFADDLTIVTQTTRVTIAAGAGNDVIRSDRSSVTVDGGAGNDRFFSGVAGDIFDGGAGKDTIDYRHHASPVVVELGAKAGDLGVGAGGDQLRNVEIVVGSKFSDKLVGSDASDRLIGGAGNDLLNGRAGDDVLVGGLGDDEYIVSEPGDRIIERAKQGTDTVYSSIDYRLSVTIENLTLTTLAAINGTGNDTANTITGNAGDNRISGRGGDDLLTGMGGDDRLDGGSGDDDLDGGAGRDVLTGGAGADRFIFRNGESGGGGGSADVITDFSRRQGDKIVLTLMDGDTRTEARDALNFIGTAAFTGVAGEVRYDITNGATFIHIDTDGDTLTDLDIRLTGTLHLVAGDFAL